MINFTSIDKETFLNEYWQKKPLVIHNALPDFSAPIEADELAGLALEDDIESRMVFANPKDSTDWRLERGPFEQEVFTGLPPSHWTLLVQGVDAMVPEVSALLKHFDFIPPWRIDDVMVSFATLGGGVGPHYDNYDVFLYQAMGQRRWSLTTKNCHEDNVIEGLELRIMKEFETEIEYVLEPGDMLYLPAHVGHHGLSLSDECMTYSFGYRSYQAQELWDGFGDYLSEQGLGRTLYCDPNWSKLQNPSEIPSQAVFEAKRLMQLMLDDEESLVRWFGRFASQLDANIMQNLDEPLSAEEAGSLSDFLQALHQARGLMRQPNCRLVYHFEGSRACLSVNGESWARGEASNEVVKLVANQREISMQALSNCFESHADQLFVYDLYKQGVLLLDECHPERS